MNDFFENIPHRNHELVSERAHFTCSISKYLVNGTNQFLVTSHPSWTFGTVIGEVARLIIGGEYERLFMTWNTGSVLLFEKSDSEQVLVSMLHRNGDNKSYVEMLYHTSLPEYYGLALVSSEVLTDGFNRFALGYDDVKMEE